MRTMQWDKISYEGFLFIIVLEKHIKPKVIMPREQNIRKFVLTTDEMTQ